GQPVAGAQPGMAGVHAAAAGELQAGAGDPVQPLRLRRAERAASSRPGSAAPRHRRRVRGRAPRAVRNGDATMTDMPASPAPSSQEAALAAEDEGYYHESALNAAWTGSRLAIGGLAFLFGSFVFAYFYLRSLDSEARWQGSGYRHPSLW